MKKTLIQSFATLTLLATLATSCNRDVEFNSLNQGNFTDTIGSLKDISTFPIGFAVDNPSFANDAEIGRAHV